MNIEIDFTIGNDISKDIDIYFKIDIIILNYIDNNNTDTSTFC